MLDTRLRSRIYCSILFLGLNFLTTTAFSNGYDTMFSNGGNYVEQSEPVPEVEVPFETVNSFPIYVTGSHPRARIRSKSKTPKILHTKINIQGCSFVLHSGNFSVSSFRPNQQGKYEVLEDALISGTIMTPDQETGSVLLSLSTNLSATPLPSKTSQCEKIYSGPSTKIGSFSMAQSKFGLNKKPKRTKIFEIQHAPEVELFLRWSPNSETLVLTDQDGNTPLAESEVFAIRGIPKGAFGISFKPEGTFKPIRPVISGVYETQK